ncbi:hypothetical protein [Spirosoma utsteinense]|uniref:Transposase n=1 Tax=Spirosoma utsteinense TaxID=2585773 RepID=A0ABR6WDE9_9BACT|nr:hypothetical protein [Spirosoma utsteinense]MBC3788527.1 hypothetical protein [Spirosoma utsteinense]MBC3794583.1 hypothetical protein [Spirosoma utsteinense]
MQRGKNDNVDVQRIAEYAYRFRNQIRLWQPPRPVIQQLAFLSAARQRLIQAYNLLADPLTEQDSFINPLLQKQLQPVRRCGSSRKSLIALKDEKKAIEQQINGLIQNNGRLKELFDWIVSVPGIGSTTATEIIVVTNEMTTITDPKQMACVTQAWYPLSSAQEQVSGARLELVIKLGSA